MMISRSPRWLMIQGKYDEVITICCPVQLGVLTVSSCRHLKSFFACGAQRFLLPKSYASYIILHRRESSRPHLICIVDSIQVERWAYSRDEARPKSAQTDPENQNGATVRESGVDEDDPFGPEIGRVRYLRHLRNFFTYPRHVCLFIESDPVS